MKSTQSPSTVPISIEIRSDTLTCKATKTWLYDKKSADACYGQDYAIILRRNIMQHVTEKNCTWLHSSAVMQSFWQQHEFQLAD